MRLFRLLEFANQDIKSTQIWLVRGFKLHEVPRQLSTLPRDKRPRTPIEQPMTASRSASARNRNNQLNDVTKTHMRHHHGDDMERKQ
jgi:hypothetical protein